MQISKRRGIAIAAALVLGGACVASQPAVAGQAAPTGSIDSREIKDKTIQPKDLRPGLLSKINSALQEIADASVTTDKLADAAVTTDKLADNAVTNPKLADSSVSGPEVTDGSIGAADIGPNAINSEELANDSVDGGAVANGSLQAADVASVRGVANLDFPLINAGSCQVIQIATGNALDNDLIMVTAGPTIAGIITVEGRQASAGSQNIAVLACNHAGVALNPALTSFSWAVLEN